MSSDVTASRPPADAPSRHVDGDRYRRLFVAQRTIARDLDLAAMAQRIVDAAREVVAVSMAALAVIDTDDVVEGFVHSGLDDDTAAALRAVATGSRFHATVGALARAADCSSRQDADVPVDTGVPEYLSVRIEAGGKPFADLYVAGPAGRTFDDADVELLTALARSAGSAVAHAREFARSTRSTAWLHASGEIARALLAEADVDMFGEIVQRAVTAAGADNGGLMVPCADGTLKIIATAGAAAGALLGHTVDHDVSDVGRAVMNGKTLRAPDVTPLLSENFGSDTEWGPAMIAPLLDAIGTRGSVMVTRRRGRPPFTDDELMLFATYASQVALAVQFADSRADAERMQVLETRHNIARELHDIVMQRLFATGMGLQTLGGQIADAAQSEQIARYVQDLDDTIDEIRDRVFGLEGDAASAAPRETSFPRIALGLEPATVADSAAVRSVVKRGRRRSDWTDGTGVRRE